VDDPSFGTVLRELRRRRGISLAEFSALTHYSKGYLSRIETGKRTPSPSLASRFDEVLRAEGTLADLVPAQRRRPAPCAPAQLPAAPRLFVGRSEALTELDAAQTRHRVVIISGLAGVGKTALALRWSCQAARRFPDGCLFVDLHGFDQSGTPAEPADALGRLLRDLGCPPESVPPGLESRSALLRTLLCDRRALIVVDNAATAGQVRPLIPGGDSCRLIVTSRSRLSGLVARDGAARLVLAPLREQEAQTLLEHAIGSRAVEDAEATAAVARLCGHLPLALWIAADRAQARPALRLAALAAELGVAHDRLTLLSAADDETAAVRSSFSWSYRALAPDAARLFRLLGRYPGREVGTAVAAAIAGIGRSHAYRLLDALAAVHLLEEAGPGRYRFHDLVRLYAAERAEAEESSVAGLFTGFPRIAADG
jgi:transcriptional regulator with XRE-family HTH domain